MTNAQTRIATTIHHFYDDSAPMGQCGIKYKETVEKLDEEAKKDMVGEASLFTFGNGTFLMRRVSGCYIQNDYHRTIESILRILP